MAIPLLGMLVPVLGTLVERIFPDKEAQAKAKAEIFGMIQAGELQTIKTQGTIISDEAKSDSWLTSSWRPISMLIFLAMIVSYWFGYTPPNITEDLLLELFSLVKIGLGGYVVGRSGEKMIKVWKQKGE